jgi:hypothetical protein
LVDLQAQMVNFVAAQEERNRLQIHAEQERHDDRWQVWIRWAITPGIPIAVLVLPAWREMSGG